MSDPELPYAGTSGWSGSDTSRDRATRADSDGTTSRTQSAVMSAVAAAGPRGITVAEARALGFHHGQASGALSVLHKTGHLERLVERRDRCAIYVLPGNVLGRETRPQGRQTCSCVLCPGHDDE